MATETNPAPAPGSALERIEAALKRMTPGPWDTTLDPRVLAVGPLSVETRAWHHTHGKCPAWDYCQQCNQAMADASGMATLRNHAPALASELRAARSEVERLRDVIRWTHASYCTPAWTDRDRHAPECLLYEIDDPAPREATP